MHSSKYSRHFLSPALTVSGTLLAWWPSVGQRPRYGVLILLHPCYARLASLTTRRFDLLFVNSLLHLLGQQHLLPILLSYVRSGGSWHCSCPIASMNRGTS
ncbi:hypothetical protein B0O95_11416 [Mycetohabitans endofungorum]|uniref:Uncharacterized protein n=1 Tax=Mycetohabitans endofungorum TaxID=417203 RepID=A0A2P5K7K9_9BURK|nr:hypothetical protein B0O95_11416 [Mycetohabitans endofungorum]